MIPIITVDKTQRNLISNISSEKERDDDDESIGQIKSDTKYQKILNDVG